MHLLVTGAWQDALEHIGELEKIGYEVLFLQQERDSLPCEPDWIDGVICNGLFLYHPIQQFTNLKWIQLTAAGFDRVPMDYIKEHNIEIHNARGVYSIPMAEFAVAGVLSLYKGLGQFHDQQKAHAWIKNRNLRELYGSHVVIIGCGSVGTECAKRFKAFGCTITGIDISPRTDESYDVILGLDRLEDELPKADVVILTVPLTDETRGLIDAKRLSLIKGILVNIARGAIIDQKALEDWSGEAMLDVFDEEPLCEESALWDKEKRIITPHNSFVGNGNGQRLSKLIFKNLGENYEY